MMIDTGNAIMENEEINDYILDNIDILKHFHVSEPYMKGTLLDYHCHHTKIARTLHLMDYRGGVTLEMLSSSIEDFKQNLNLFTTFY